ncbi:MAG TPA: hypothetical protein PLS10_08565 [Chitinophagales bacterium]|nr:hypothetical protein [Chitinophagales bacterium]
MKKTITIISILMTNYLFSQTSNNYDSINLQNRKKNILVNNNIDCSKYISVTFDEVSGKTTTAAKDFILLNDELKLSDYLKLLISLGNNKSNELIFYFYAKGNVGCTDEDGLINILFTDGSRIELHNRDFNCKNVSSFYLGGIWGFDDELYQLKSKKIKTIRVWFTSKFIEKTLTAEQQITIYNTINCLMQTK